MNYLTAWDLVLAPIYLMVLVYLAKRHRDKKYPKGHPLRPYFLPGLYVKFGGAIFIALIYQYYYGGGDTFNFYSDAKIVNSALGDSFSSWFSLVTRSGSPSDPILYGYISQMQWYHDPSSYTVVMVSAILGLLNGTTYIPIALLFAYLSYTGIWAMYKTFASIYPKAARELSLAFLFIPSTFVWGSGVFKDTICMFGLGWLTYTTFRIFINRDLSARNFIFFVLSVYLVAKVKVYIILGFAPALCLWLMLNYSKKIRSLAVRWIANIIFIGLIIAGFLFFTQKFADDLNKYSLDKIAETAVVTRDWIQYSSGDEGSAYTLGEMDGTLMGMLQKFPAAVVVTLFRPFLWESKKLIILLSALEAIVFLYFTVRAVFARRGKLFSLLAKDPNMLFCLVFALIFAFAIGISTYNFGSLSRYKIPCLPFFACFLVVAFKKLSLKFPFKRNTKAAWQPRRRLVRSG